MKTQDIFLIGINCDNIPYAWSKESDETFDNYIQRMRKMIRSDQSFYCTILTIGRNHATREEHIEFLAKYFPKHTVSDKPSVYGWKANPKANSELMMEKLV